MDSVTLCVILGAAAAGLVQGLSGFAFGLVAMSFWAWVVPAQLAGPMVVFGSLVGQLMSAGVIRRGFDRRRIAPFLIGGLLGVPIGVMLLRRLDPALFKLALGLLLAVYCPILLLARELPVIARPVRAADAAVGFVSGVMGGIGGFTGPAMTLWCAMRSWSNDARRAVFQTFNLVMHGATLAAYGISGLVTVEAAWMFALVVPAMLVPNLIGVRLYGRISDIGFRRLILVLLTGSGVMLVAAAGAELLRR